MTVTNILANLFTSLQNAEMRSKKECVVIPASNLASEVMRVLQKRRYIGEFEFIDDGVSGKLQGPAAGADKQVRRRSSRVTRSRRRTTQSGRAGTCRRSASGCSIVSTPKGCCRTPRRRRRTLEGDYLGYVY